MHVGASCHVINFEKSSTTFSKNFTVVIFFYYVNQIMPEGIWKFLENKIFIVAVKL